MNTRESPFPSLYRRRPDEVEAMQWNPSDASMQGVMRWLREESQPFKTVGRQLWVTVNDSGLTMIVDPGDWVLRRTTGQRHFYSESAEKFNAERESMADAVNARGE